MRFRTNLKLVIGGFAAASVILPFCVGLLVWLAASSRIDEQPQLRLHLIEVEISQAVLKDVSRGMRVREGYRPPEGFSLVLAGPGGEVLYSSLPGLALGSRVDLASVARAMGALPGSTSFCAENVESRGVFLGSYYAWMPAKPFSSPLPPERSIRASLMALGLVVVVFVLGALIATKLARAVFRIEDAARRIAAGDLGTELGVDEDIREIRDLAEAMNSMRSALRENRDRRARFLAAVSHDLRTPLTSIGGYLEAVSDGLAGDPATLERYVSIMRAKTRLLEDRIGSLIEFARMETEEWRMGFEKVELRPFLESLSREFREDAALMGREFAYELSALEGLVVDADRTLLTRALENLMSNAIRYTPAGGRVGTRAERAEVSGGAAGYLIHIDDSGPGIAPAERERIFEPFFRGSAAREGEGIGMGLYIVASVIEGHGWKVRAGEAPGGGGRFTVSIPSSLSP